jgi:NAD(P)-dependent dehydrogenase (short-subunit alcohol dehydrogenase family)
MSAVSPRSSSAPDRVTVLDLEFALVLRFADDASAAVAAGLVGERAGRLDVLVNNAGVTGGMPQAPTTAPRVCSAPGARPGSRTAPIAGDTRRELSLDAG